MPSNRLLIPAAVVAGIVLVIVGAVYLAEPAKSLPFPDMLGHEAGSNHHHIKHGIAAVLLGVACFVFAWFQSGPRSSAAAR
jgi:ABC-type enterobactin transport system permease subunit